MLKAAEQTSSRQVRSTRKKRATLASLPQLGHRASVADPAFSPLSPFAAPNLPPPLARILLRLPTALLMATSARRLARLKLFVGDSTSALKTQSAVRKAGERGGGKDFGDCWRQRIHETKGLVRADRTLTSYLMHLDTSAEIDRCWRLTGTPQS